MVNLAKQRRQNHNLDVIELDRMVIDFNEISAYINTKIKIVELLF